VQKFSYNWKLSALIKTLKTISLKIKHGKEEVASCWVSRSKKKYSKKERCC
jgi:hypothetical protein